jgi:hypothetical protein
VHPLRLAGDGAGDEPHLVGAEEVVHLGHLLGQLLGVPLGEAAGYHQALAAPALLVAGHLQDGVHRLLLGLPDEAAGVHHDHLGVGGVRHHPMAGVGEVPEHDLGVDPVLGAPERDEVDGLAGGGGHRKGGSIARG